MSECSPCEVKHMQMQMGFGAQPCQSFEDFSVATTTTIMMIPSLLGLLLKTRSSLLLKGQLVVD